VDARTAKLIVSNNLGPIMKRIRKAIEKNKYSIGDTYNYIDEASLYVCINQKDGLEQLGYRVDITYYRENEFEDGEEQVIVRW
jgi:hypothetical protein